MSDESTDNSIGGAVEPAADGGAEGGNEFENSAREKGWRPKEEYEGDPEGWVGAEEFVKRQPLFDKIKNQSKKLKELERTVEALAKHYQSNVQQARDRALAELKAERKEAIEMGEADKVELIDERIQTVKQMPDPVAPPPSLAPEIEQFVESNKEWFNKDQDMTAFAVSYNEAYLKNHPGDLAKSLDETIKAVKRAYPDKFANQKRTAPPAVEGGGAPLGSNSKYSVSRLNREQKLVYDQLVKVHKQMSHDDYFKSLESAGYLEG